MTDTLRTQIVQAARDWLDTPFHHQARQRGLGVDCVGLVIGVCRELGLIAPDFDVTGYPRIPDGRSFIFLADMHLRRIDFDQAQPGDAVVVSYDKDPQHIGILGDYRHGGFSIIHGSSDAGRVIETRLMWSDHMRFVAAFALPGTY